jgi:hypothetical protein
MNFQAWSATTDLLSWKLFGDKGYLSKALRDELWRMFKVQLITGIRAKIRIGTLRGAAL